MPTIVEQIGSWKLVPVVSLTSPEDAQPLAAALAEGGLPCAEITLRSDAAIGAIERLATLENFLVGAGTVHSVAQAQRAVDAGARFIVSPGMNPKTIAWCLDNQVPIFPGASSPTDLETALDMGLKVVKFFPAEALGGCSMLKALMAPYGELRFMPTGGIHQDNLAEYLSLKQVLACGGSWMVAPQLIAAGRFDEIRRKTAEAIALSHMYLDP